MTLGDCIKQLREYNGLTLRGLAKKTKKLTLGGLSKIERGGNTTIESLEDIAGALNCQLEIRFIPNHYGDIVSTSCLGIEEDAA